MRDLHSKIHLSSFSSISMITGFYPLSIFFIDALAVINFVDGSYPFSYFFAITKNLDADKFTECYCANLTTSLLQDIVYDFTFPRLKDESFEMFSLSITHKRFTSLFSFSNKVFSTFFKKLFLHLMYAYIAKIVFGCAIYKKFVKNIHITRYVVHVGFSKA